MVDLGQGGLIGDKSNMEIVKGELILNSVKKIVESVKQLYTVFTNKLLFIEWILQVLRAIAIYFLKMKSRIEADAFAETNGSVDLRTMPPAVRRNIIHDEAVLKMRWDLCSSCEFLTEKNSCQKCGCFMKIKHKLSHAKCPIGKWDQYKPEVISGTPVTS